MPYTRELDYTLIGIAFARNWLVGERSSSDRLLAAAAELAEGEKEWFEAPLQDASAGYAAWSASYDEPGNPVVAIEGDALRELFIALRPGYALDAACGTGRHALTLEQLGHGVVGVDASEAMLARAREKSPTLDLRTGDLTALPLEDASVDLAVCALALTHLPELGPPLAELVRVVRPGGRVILSDVHPTNVMLGAQALYGTAAGRGYVRNHVHRHGAYIAAANAAGLQITACHELVYRREESDVFAERIDLPADVVANALVGFPAVVVWELERP